MMLYIIIVKVRKFHQPTANRFSTAKKNPVGGGGGAQCAPSLNRVKALKTLKSFKQGDKTTMIITYYS